MDSVANCLAHDSDRAAGNVPMRLCRVDGLKGVVVPDLGWAGVLSEEAGLPNRAPAASHPALPDQSDHPEGAVLVRALEEELADAGIHLMQSAFRVARGESAGDRAPGALHWRRRPCARSCPGEP